MSASHTSSRFAQPSALPGVVNALFDEAVEFFKALLSPSKLIVEVEQMHALQVEARRIEASEPGRAAMLRRQAARIGLR